MLEVIDVPAENVIGLQLDGKINKQDICKILSPIRYALECNTTVNIYIEIDTLEGFSLGALYEEMKMTLPQIRHFKKEAVVTDQTSLKKWVNLGNRLWWGGEVKYFSSCDRDKALQWVQN